jgi:hypothetical protein
MVGISLLRVQLAASAQKEQQKHRRAPFRVHEASLIIASQLASSDSRSRSVARAAGAQSWGQ